MKKRYKILIGIGIIYAVITLIKGMSKLFFLLPAPIIALILFFLYFSDDECTY